MAEQNFKARTMFEYSLKTYRNTAEIETPHFYILNRGMNSGKPLEKPCANCFVLFAKTEEEKQKFYWLCFGLWRAKSFHYYLKGSVIPFITKDDLKKGINHGMEQASTNFETFENSVKALRLLEEKQKQFMQNLLLIEEAKKAIFYRYMRRR